MKKSTWIYLAFIVILLAVTAYFVLDGRVDGSHNLQKTLAPDSLWITSRP
jgi:hypothetical protein